MVTNRPRDSLRGKEYRDIDSGPIGKYGGSQHWQAIRLQEARFPAPVTQCRSGTVRFFVRAVAQRIQKHPGPGNGIQVPVRLSTQLFKVKVASTACRVGLAPGHSIGATYWLGFGQQGSEDAPKLLAPSEFTNGCCNPDLSRLTCPLDNRFTGKPRRSPCHARNFRQCLQDPDIHPPNGHCRADPHSSCNQPGRWYRP